MNPNSECASFVLRTCDLPTFASGPNTIGSTNNASGSSYTWSNVDFRAILGEMYTKYDSFNIGLVNMVSTSQPTPFTLPSSDHKLGVLYMSGLRWKNSSYDLKSKSKTDNCAIGFVNLSTITTTTGSVIQYNGLSLNSIDKPNENTNITIFFNTIATNTPNATTSGAFPQMSFQFVIYPIQMLDPIEAKKEENKEGALNHRIKL